MKKKEQNDPLYGHATSRRRYPFSSHPQMWVIPKQETVFECGFLEALWHYYFENKEKRAFGKSYDQKV
ncbi:MAG: hypothetical protein NMK33_05660 [Candidatus Cardinium sp.]|uniref:hypothetical protein n=1 Tax=Cardinium endosymbiont of Dermatophagoides farinae TaxID=2597823 RepID=UPI001181D044|nr:hypothetical protein [Cardinium endosymbiont of Dermatophagoides farinae]TSJ80892.1 hypothetical protein FPG78_02455 [Cardinium endosymbiont of Dermatophagoides farinae]UWW96904.1 MAG: hypothetical protein NMK33_05660 [Candidatus Cardinium sp.]